MKPWLFLFASSLVFAADWDAVQRPVAGDSGLSESGRRRGA